MGDSADETTNDLELRRLVAEEIRDRGPMSFDRFMDVALYTPGLGYYATGDDRIGRHGDFFTASDAGRAFGACVAAQIAEADSLAGPFDPLDILEFGAGRGLLARDVLDSLKRRTPEVSARARYTLVDRSPAMRERAAANAPEARIAAPGDVGRNLRGCVLAVELFDALPVRRVRRRGDGRFEVVVDLDEAGRLVERELPADDELLEFCRRHGAAERDGFEAELAPSLHEVFTSLHGTLEQGLILIVDYGGRSEELYGVERKRGTLLAYHAQQTNEDYLSRIGDQDLTAHVNFSALEEHAIAAGLQVLTLTTQDRFLVANGILTEFESESEREYHDPARVKRRMQAMQLIHPQGMGRRFRVLALAKNCPALAEAKGLIDPFRRGGSVT